MRAVDTNVLVRLMTRDDVKQVAFAEAFVANVAWVPHLAIADATWVLGSARKAGHTPLGTLDRELGKIDGAQRL